ncbi:MAG: Hint domain-containing protein [Pseudomonadota bacterium]
MADYSIWIVEGLNISVSGGKSLSGFTQGDASHLDGETIRLDALNLTEVEVRDGGSDSDFDDNDGNQRLNGAQTINGTSYSNQTVVEAEYTVVLRDPNTGIEYTAVGVNLRDSSPSYATVEGLAFVGGQGGFPPTGVDLVVVDTREGPGDFGQPAIAAPEFAFPICFTPGTRIAVPSGERRIEDLCVGSLVLTRDRGPQPVRWIGRTDVSPADVAAKDSFLPVRIEMGALGGGLPDRDLVVSQQHRVLIRGWKAELLFGEREVLAAAKHLVGRPGIALDFAPGGVTYLHMMFDAHEIIWANGAQAESFRPGPATIAAMDGETRREFLELFPEFHSVDPARGLLRGWEAGALSG